MSCIYFVARIDACCGRINDWQASRSVALPAKQLKRHGSYGSRLLCLPHSSSAAPAAHGAHLSTINRYSRAELV